MEKVVAEVMQVDKAVELFQSSSKEWATFFLLCKLLVFLGEGN
jgi:hypothetical protein